MPTASLGLAGDSNTGLSCELYHPSTSAWQTLGIKNNDDSSQCAIELFSSQGTKRGIVYASSGGQGFLTTSASWVFQITTDNRFLLGGASASACDPYDSLVIYNNTQTSGGISILHTTSGRQASAFAFYNSTTSRSGHLSFNFDTNHMQLRNESGGSLNISTSDTSASMGFDSGGFFYNSSIQANTTSFTANINISSSYMKRSTSARRYKENIRHGTKGLDHVMRLMPRTFNSKGGADGDHTFYGFIAEELVDVGLEEFVVHQDHEDGTRTVEGIEYAHMVSLLTKAIQELKAQLDAK